MQQAEKWLHKEVPTLLPRAYAYVTLQSKRDLPDVMERETLWWENDTRLFRLAHCDHKGPQKMKREAEGDVAMEEVRAM